MDLRATHMVKDDKSPEKQSSARPQISRRLLMRNTLLNLVGQLLPLLVGIVCMPFIVRGLSSDRFGILGIVWVVFSYFNLFDFGLGRATTRFLAEAQATGKTAEVSGLVWTSMIVQVLLGIATGALITVSVPVLVDNVLKVPAELVGETKVTLYILGASVPVFLATSGFRAVLEGCQRFDLSNLLRVPATTLTFVIPALSLPFGLQLPAIVFLLLISRLIIAVAHLRLCLTALPALRGWTGFEMRTVLPLLSYGGWVTVGNVVNPILLYIDRFMIAYLLSLAWVGYYSAPFEAVTKLWLIPASLATTIFPACSILATNRVGRQEGLYSESFKYLFLVLSPIALLLFAFAGNIVHLWLGAEFASKSTFVMKILIVGVFINCFAHIPFSLLHGLGRPDASAKLFLAELPPYALLAWWLIRNYGIAGAAVAWSARVAIELALLTFLAWRLHSLSPGPLRDKGLVKGIGVFLTLAILIAFTLLMFRGSFLTQAAVSAIWLGGFIMAVWRFAFDDSDRESVLSLMNPIISAFKNRGTA